MNSTIKIIESRPGENTFHYFDEILTKVYPPESLRFKAKESFNEIYFHSCIIALIDNEVAGRLCIYLNPNITVEGQQCLLIGNFEVIKDESVCNALIKYAENIARNLFVSYLIGPVNGSTWDDYRFPLTACIDPYLTDSLQPVYYAEMFEKNNFQVLHRYYTSIAENDGNKKILPEEIEHLKNNGIAVRQINLGCFKTELRKVHELCIESFKNNPLYSPVEEDYLIKKYIGLKDLLDPAFILLAEKDGKLVALYFCLPDIYQHRIIIKTIAKHPDCDVKGLMNIMGKMIYEAGREKGYKMFIHAYMHEHNRSVNISKNFYGTILREYAVFIKQLAP